MTFSSPTVALLGISCVLAYCFARRLTQLRLPSAVTPLLSPPLIGALLVYAACRGLHVGYAAFAPVAALSTMLLVPATIALALPLYRNRTAVARHVRPACIALVAGSLASMASAFAFARLFALDSSFGAMLGIKSATAAIALEIALRHRLDPFTTATLVVATGIFGAIAGPYVLNLARIRDPIARGLAYGATSHAIGTARAMSENELSGAVSGVALCLNGIFVAFAAPLALWLAYGR